MGTEELAEIERAGRRCGVCRSGRRWRGFEIVRPAGRELVVLCAGCRARFGEGPPVARKPSSADPAGAVAEPPAPPPASTDRERTRRPDRLRAALAQLPSSFSTAVASRAAGLSNEKALSRLQELEDREVRRVGKRWSTEAPASDLTAAMDRLEARTSNLRIVRERARVG
jgi:hypothetical protein